MSFLDKTFKRVSSENLEELAASQNIGDRIAPVLKGDATFTFTKTDDGTFTFKLQMTERAITSTFRLGEEHEAERRDGEKVKVTYELESDNVLKQTLIHPGGRVTHFRREFDGDKCSMTINVEGCDIVAKIFYEAI